MMTSRAVHRIASIAIAIFTLYLGLTGSLIESVDFKTIITRPQPFDPDLMAMREDFAGPPNFRVLATADNLAQPLPRDAALAPMLAQSVAGFQATRPSARPSFVELRMIAGRPIGQVKEGDHVLRFDALRSTYLGEAPPLLNENEPPASFRNTVKHLHRMTTFGDWALWINIIVSLGLATLIITGLIVYLKLWRVRRKIKRPNPYWTAGGWWRALHRSISMTAILFLTLTTVSGAWLAFESLIFGMSLSRSPAALMADASSPLDMSKLPAMLKTTLSAYRRDAGLQPIRVVRLRNYGLWHQGIVITGGEAARQLVFDTNTGNSLSLTERGYPATGFPFGWQMHQYAKSIHRGDFFGLTGRVTSLLAGLSMIYLSISGIVMYVEMWRKRRRSGRSALVWK